MTSKLKNRILNFFNLISLTEYNLKVDTEKKLNDSLAALTQAQINMWAQEKPKMTYDEYLKSIGTDYFTAAKTKDVWNNYYNKYHRDQYQAFKIRNLTKHPHLLHAFLNEFGSFDWVKVRDYMKSVNWTWSDHDLTPTIEELKDCVIGLIPCDNYDNTENDLMSGGFYVSLYYLEGKPVCKIEFKEK